MVCFVCRRQGIERPDRHRPVSVPSGHGSAWSFLHAAQHTLLLMDWPIKGLRSGTVTLRGPGMGRGIYSLLVFSVIVSAWATSALAPKGRIEVPCGVGSIALAVEVCPPNDVKATLGAVGSGLRQQLHDQTLVDFVLIASYLGLWGATALALHPGVALVAAAAGAADVVENPAILHELSRPDPLALVQWAGLTKWGLLGIVFLTFVFLFRPHRVSPRWTPLLRAATGLAY